MKCKYILALAIFLLFVFGSFFNNNSEAGQQSTISKIEAPYEHLLNILATDESTKSLSTSQIHEVSEADLSDTDMHYIAIMRKAVEKYNHCKQGCRIKKICCAYIDGRKSLYVQASLTQSGEAAKNPFTGGLLDLGILHYRSCSIIFKSDFIYCATSNGSGLSLTNVDKMRRESKNFTEAAKILPNYTTKYSLNDY